VAPQDVQICGGNSPKHKKMAANTSYGWKICAWLYPAGVHCPAWDDAFGF